MLEQFSLRKPSFSLRKPSYYFSMNYCGLEFDIVRASDKLPIYSKEDSNRTLHYCVGEGMEYFLSFRATQKFLSVDVTVDNERYRSLWMGSRETRFYMPCNIETKKPTMKLGVIKFQVYERVPSYTASENTIKCRESTSGRAVYLPHEGTLLADVEVRYGVEKLLVQSSIVVSEEIRNYERKRKRELVDSEKKGEPARKKKREKILGFGRTDLEPEKKRLKKIEKKRLQKIEKKRLQKIEKKRLQKIEEERVKERIKEKRRKTTTSDSDSSDSGNKSLTSLSERKKMLKAQLKKFDSDFCRERGRLPREAEKEPIWHLYEQYNKLKGLLEKANNKTKKPVNTKKGGGRRSYPEQSQSQSSDESSDSGSNSETETQDEKSGKGKKTKEKSEQQGNGKTIKAIKAITGFYFTI